MSPAVARKDTKAKKAAPVKFTIDCSGPVNDGIFDAAAFEKFLHDRIKVAGRTNNLGDAVTIARATGSITVTVSANTQFAKRYLKYLTKKYLKKNQLRDWLRVIATSKGAYELRYFNVAAGDDEEEEEADA
ncbi:putative 60S ribosomal protein L22 [Polychytrium aggregatum]|uniref:putative 60S ribosomal protein L22 n=1 Tax=Polychytrium aggregatum TaxID=110093 RepID=UPI0022FE37BC|nr:putative 60S ribosomal protein L22 [Polychytrium aggregatum]KAI9208934.1 putative 60S ribosomal protein L22 [Polychytrium aggregatum]